MKAICITFLIALPYIGYSQDLYALKSGNISFFAGTPIEDIDAHNTKIRSFLNLKTGEVAITIPNREFIFRRSLMQEHFNENYMESEKYLNSEFKGKILNIEETHLSIPGEYKVQVEGNFMIHGVTKSRKIDVTITNKDGKIQVDSKFQILLADYKIDRPQIVWEKLEDNVQVTLLLNYEIYKK